MMEIQIFSGHNDFVESQLCWMSTKWSRDMEKVLYYGSITFLTSELQSVITAQTSHLTSSIQVSRGDRLVIYHPCSFCTVWLVCHFL